MRKTLLLLLFMVFTESGTFAHPTSQAQADEKTVVDLHDLARHRMAFASSQFDNNLTAQLVTDGMVPSDKEVLRYLRVTTPDGLVVRREREWSLDECPYTHNVMKGADSYLQYQMVGYCRITDKVCLEGQVAYHEDRFHEGDPYTIVLESSADGKEWTVLSKHEGKGLPGTKAWSQLHSDPDKRLEQGSLPTRNITDTLEVAQAREYSFLRIAFSMPSASHWSLSQANFYYKEQLLDMKPAQYFYSSWKSQELSSRKQEEWVYVDLGRVCDFSAIRLHWTDKAIKGKIQTSADAKVWKTIAQLPGGPAAKDEIAVKGKGRYVRLLMQEAVTETYTLKEMEILGQQVKESASLQVSPSLSGEGGRLDLVSNWELTRDGSEDWIPATVPGTVLTSYMNIGAVPNTNYANNGLQISESYFRSNFWYRNTFRVPEGFRRERIYLNFDGINWKANIWLNDKLLGRSEGAFIRSSFEVSDYLVDGENKLLVEVICPAHFGAAKEKNRMNTAINGGILGADNPTFHATVGWDWINSTRGRNTGIWNDVYLFTTEAVKLNDPFVDCKLNLPDTTIAILRPEVVCSNDGKGPVQGVLKGRIGDVEFSKTISLKAGETRTVCFEPEEFPQLIFRNPKLWWPNGYGEPHLYESSFTFCSQTGTEKVGVESAPLSFKTGIRQVTWNTANEKLTLFVNGKRFIGKGGNWGFSEHNLQYTDREYDAAVKYHKEMNFTMIRNWVGQIGDDEFYEACDRYGIMVWQDFWLANPCDGPDPDDEQMFALNAEDMVSRIRNHPSLCLYCGRNEGFPPATLNKALQRIVKDIHPGMPYIGSSADDIVTGHGPYWAVYPREYFELKAGADKFHSERGMPCIMNYESLKRTLKPEDLWPQGDAWGEHDFTLEGAQRGSSFNEMLAKMFGEPKSAEEFCRLAQWINYDGYRAMFESRSKHRRGLLLWMTHPCWPSMVWQTYDYYLDPTAAYFGCMHGCEPLHVQWNAATNKVEVVALPLLSAKVERATVVAEVYDMRGNLCWSKTAETPVAEDATQELFELEYPDNAGEVQLIRLVLKDKKGNVLSRNDYVHGREEGNLQALRRLPASKVDFSFIPQGEKDGELHYEATVTNKGKETAYMLRLKVVGEDGEQILPVIYEDNYLHLLPGESRTLHISMKKADTRGQQPRLQVLKM